jgi:VWFA-related protein
LTFAFVVACLGPASAQQPPQKPPAQPTFRTGIELVQLDVSVIDKNRQPVRGLTARDFTIKEDGKPQKIVALAENDVPDAVVPSAPWIRETSPDVTKNEPVGNRRLFVIVMDDAMMVPDAWMIRSAKQIARSVIEKLSPDDLAAVVFTSDNRGAQDFTTDRARLLAAVDRFTVGFHDPAAFPPIANERAFLDSVQTLSRAAEFLIGVPQGRKTLVYVGNGVPVDPASTAPTQIQSISGLPRVRSVLPPPADFAIAIKEMQTRLIDEMKRVFEQARLANVTVYTFDSGGLGGMDNYIAELIRERGSEWVPAFENPRNYRDFALTIANNTGGHATMNTNDFEPGISQMFQENASYYAIGYESSNPKRNGDYRRLEATVNRPDVRARVKNGYFAPDAKQSEKVATATAGVSSERKALAGLLPKADVPMQMSAAPFAVPGQTAATVAIVLGFRQPDEVPAKGGSEQLDVTVNAFTPEGKPQGSQTLKAQVKRQPGAAGQLTHELLSTLDLQPGRYELRVAANHVQSNTSGSVYYDLDVPDFSKNPLSLSGAILRVSPGVVAASSDRLRALVPIVPTSQREFSPADRVTAFLRVYQGGSSALVPVAFSVRVLDGQGATISSVPQTIGPDRFSDARAADYRVDLSLAALKAGPHLLTFEATIGKISVRRDVQFVVTR